MKSKTYIKLTNEESIVLMRALEILEELWEEHLPECSEMAEKTSTAFNNLLDVVHYLEDMGNDFRVPQHWKAEVEEKVADLYEPDVEEMMADCWEFTFER